MNKMDSNSTDVHRQSQKLLEKTTTKNLVTDDIIHQPVASITATKQLNDKEILSSQALDTLPKVLYLKKLSHPTIQLKNSSMNSIKEPIPKLIVSTKSIKLANQLITPDGVRYITAARKSATPETSDNSTIKQADAIKSTKIIIKGITSQDKRLVVCESPTTDPLGSPQLSPTHVDSVKNNSIGSEQSSIEIDERVKTTEPAAGGLNEENRPASTTSTPRANREMKQLQKTMKESKVLTDFVTLGDATRRIKRKLNETEENESMATPVADDTSQKIVARSRSLSVSKDTNEVSISIRRNTRSLNAEFSAKQRKFLAGIQKHSRDSDDDHSDDERGRGRRKVHRKSWKPYAPLKVSGIFFDIFFLFCKVNGIGRPRN